MADIEGGYIKLYRKMTKWQWYSDEVMFRVFMHLLLTANYEPAYWRDVKIERGQTVVSLAKLFYKSYAADEEGNVEDRGVAGLLKKRQQEIAIRQQPRIRDDQCTEREYNTQ